MKFCCPQTKGAPRVYGSDGRPSCSWGIQDPNSPIQSNQLPKICTKNKHYIMNWTKPTHSDYNSPSGMWKTYQKVVCTTRNSWLMSLSAAMKKTKISSLIWTQSTEIIYVTGFSKWRKYSACKHQIHPCQAWYTNIFDIEKEKNNESEENNSNKIQSDGTKESMNSPGNPEEVESMLLL